YVVCRRCCDFTTIMEMEGTLLRIFWGLLAFVSLSACSNQWWLRDDFLSSSLNQAPVARPDTFSVPRDTSLVVSIADLLSNDVDPEGDVLTFVRFDEASEEGVLLNLDGGGVLYTAPAGFVGSDYWYYVVRDRHGAESRGKVRMSVN